MGNNFCRRPFTNLNFEINGAITPCCYIYCSNEGIKHFKETSISKYLVSDDLLSLQKSFKENTKNPMCQYCWKAEESGRSTFRNSSPVAAGTGIDEIHLKSTNRCNLKCRICGPWNSTQWQAEERKHGNSLRRIASYFVGEAPNSIAANSAFLDELFEEVIPNVRKISISGGEPTLCLDTLKFFKRLQAEGHSEKIIWVNSNLTAAKAFGIDLVELWSHFPNLKLLASCDGYGRSAEYSRTGLNFDIFVENVLRFKAKVASIQCVLSIYSVFGIPELWKFCFEQGIKLNIDLVAQDFMSVQSLPPTEKQKIKDHFAAFSQRYSKDEGALASLADLKVSVVDFMFHRSLDATKNNLQFRRFNEEIDKRRGTRFEDGCPELAHWYSTIDMREFDESERLGFEHR